MITWTWALWILNGFFTMIVMFNFLIAIVTQSYDDVMSNYNVSLYKAKCHFIKKGCLLKDEIDYLLDKTQWNVKMNIVSVSQNENDDVDGQ